MKMAKFRSKQQNRAAATLIVAVVWLILEPIVASEKSRPTNWTTTSLPNEQTMARQVRSSTRDNQQLPEFAGPMRNASTVLGRDARLVCTVDNLGAYQVAWLKEETKTILSIGTNIIITNYRIFLIPDEQERQWVLLIKDVQESDRGSYQCQINTQPVRSTSVYLEVHVPPQIIESQTSQVAEAMEHSNVSLQCKASGHPKPTITWRRQDGAPIKLIGEPPLEPVSSSLLAKETAGTPTTSPSKTQSDLRSASDEQQQYQSGGGGLVSKVLEVRSERLTLTNVHRSSAGQYVCGASTSVAGQTSKSIVLYVKFAPTVTTRTKFVAASLGDQLELDCQVESFPRATSYWSKDSPVSSGLAQQQRLHPIERRPVRARPATSRPSELFAWPDLGFERHLVAGPLGGASRSPRQSNLNHIDEPQQQLERELLAERRWTAARLQDRHSYRQTTSAVSSPATPRFVEQLPTSNELANEPIGDQQLDSLERDSFVPTAASEEEAAGAFTLAAAAAAAAATEQQQATHIKHQPLPGSANGRVVSVKQTPVNPYTYMLRLSIAQMTANDFGDYTCYASNALGSGETRITVTMADVRDETSLPTLGPSLEAPNFVQAPMRQSLSQQRASVWPHSPSTNRVYDENYLQAIKNRQSGASSASVTAGKLQQQKYKLRPSSSNGAADSLELSLSRLLTLCVTTTCACLLLLVPLLSVHRHST